jgi:hypothetical protein
MNAATLHETTAISAAVAAVTGSQELLLIPLSKLRPSQSGARRTGRRYDACSPHVSCIHRARPWL